jgi:hypothetical protein
MRIFEYFIICKMGVCLICWQKVKKYAVKILARKLKVVNGGGHLYTGYYVGVKTVIVCAMAVIFLNSVLYFCYDKT